MHRFARAAPLTLVAGARPAQARRSFAAGRLRCLKKKRARHALGQDTVDLVALSCGTRLAQTYARLFPVRAMGLVDTVPMDRRVPLKHAANAQAVLEATFRVALDGGQGAALQSPMPRQLHRGLEPVLRAF